MDFLVQVSPTIVLWASQILAVIRYQDYCQSLTTASGQEPRAGADSSTIRNVILVADNDPIFSPYSSSILKRKFAKATWGDLYCSYP